MQVGKKASLRLTAPFSPRLKQGACGCEDLVNWLHRIGLLSETTWMFDDPSLLWVQIILYLVLMTFPFVGLLILTNIVYAQIENRQRRTFEKQRTKRDAAITERNKRRAERVAQIKVVKKREADLEQARAVIAGRVAERDAERELEKKLEAAARTAKRRDTSVWAIAVVIAVMSVLKEGIKSLCEKEQGLGQMNKARSITNVQ